MSAGGPAGRESQNEDEEHPLYKQLGRRLKTVPHSCMPQKSRWQGALEHEEQLLTSKDIQNTANKMLRAERQPALQLSLIHPNFSGFGTSKWLKLLSSK